MFTSRGMWLFFWGLLILIVGIYLSPGGFYPIVFLGSALVFWVVLQYGLFWLSVERLSRSVQIQVEVINERGLPQRILRTRSSYTLRITISNFSRWSAPWTLFEMIPIANWQPKSPTSQLMRLQPNETFNLDIAFTTKAVGLFQVDGLQMLIVHPLGIAFQPFCRLVQLRKWVVPNVLQVEFQHRTAKRHNTLPPPGGLRLRAPGQGSELLELRDYRAGDSPRMIAWKTSARRNKLITKELESEVPIRCTLFIDVGATNRYGPLGMRQLDRFMDVAASVAEAAILERNFVGVVGFDEQKVEELRPARTTLHRYRLQENFAQFSHLKALKTNLTIDERVRQAYPRALQMYPSLMGPQLNPITWRSLWEPVMDSKHGWKVLALLTTPCLVAIEPVRGFFASMAAEITDNRGAEFLLIFAALVLILPLLGLLFWAFYSTKWHWWKRYQMRSRRKKLAMLFSTLDSAPLKQTTEWMLDDQAFTNRLDRFLEESQAEEITFDEPALPTLLPMQAMRVQYLTRSVSRAILRARDNELFLLFIDLNELQVSLSPLMKTIRLARARHHEVLVIVPWLPGMPEESEMMEHQFLQLQSTKQEEAAQQLMSKTIQAYRDQAKKNQQLLKDAGATFVLDRVELAIPLVLRRLFALKGQRR